MEDISKLPEDWSVVGVELETSLPYALCTDNKFGLKEVKYSLNKQLAYFLITHWSGTNQLRSDIKREVQLEIKKALGLKDE